MWLLSCLCFDEGADGTLPLFPGSGWMSVAQGDWSCNMVQPSGCPDGDYGMMGDDSSLGKAGTLQLPAELAGHEAVQYFLAENRDLKGEDMLE